MIESPASNQAAHFSQLIITRLLEAGRLRCRHSGTFCKGIKLRDSRATGDFSSSFGVFWCLFRKSPERLVGVDTHLHAEGETSLRLGRVSQWEGRERNR